MNNRLLKKTFKIITVTLIVLCLPCSHGFSTNKRVVSINRCSDELLFSIADPKQIIAITKYSQNPVVERELKNNPHIKRINVNVEEILKLQPDLIFSGDFSNRDTINFLKKSGITVVNIPLPKTFDDIFLNISTMARFLGREERGELIIKEMKEKIKKNNFACKKNLRGLFFQSGGQVPGKNTFEHAILDEVGIKNIAEEFGINEYGTLSLENLIVSKPDVLIFTDAQKIPSTVRGEILSHPAILSALPNVEEIIVPAHMLTCGSPYSADTVNWLSSQIKEGHACYDEAK